MLLDFSTPGKARVDTQEYIDKILEDIDESCRRTSVTPAADHLFEVNPNQNKLNKSQSQEFHHIVAQLLKQSRPDIQTAISFLTTQVKVPDKDDQQKLIRTIKYLCGSKDLVLTMESNNQSTIYW